MRRGAPRSLALGAVLAVWGGARAEQMRLATMTPVELQRGEADGIAVTSRGRLFLAPRVSLHGRPIEGGDPAQTFAATADPAGNIFLATGPDGAIVRVSPTGDARVHFRAKEPLVTALLALPGGSLLAATAPGGRIYSVRPDGTGSLWCETEERYVWSMAPAANGGVYAATGEKGRLLRIDRNGNPTVLFDSDDSHLVSLAIARDGGLWAGGSGSGQIYRIDLEGHAVVVYADDLPEVKAIAVEPGGSIVAAFDAPPVTEKRPPAVRIRVAGGGPTGDGVGELDSREAPALQGVIEGLASDAEEAPVRIRGRVARIRSDGLARELWRSASEAPFALVLDAEGHVVFATGEPARLWRIESDSESALLTTLKEAQASALTADAKGLVAATSNPSATYRIELTPAEAGTYLAPPSDAGSVARWGRLAWRSEGSGGRVELFTRTGSSRDPDATWSAWSPALLDGAGSAVPNPEGRFLQFRARIAGVPREGPRLSGFAATYATRNRPPSIRDVRFDPSSLALAGKATVRWSASDPDGDNVAVELQIRKPGTSAWTVAARGDPAAAKPSDPSAGNDGSAREGKVTWDTATWDEGLYEVRAVASDQASNALGEGLEAIGETVTLRLDRTPPAITASRAEGGALAVAVEDALSPVVRIEVVEAGRVSFSPRCADGVCDGPRESVSLSSSEAGTEGGRTLRATDAAGNSSEAAVPDR